MCIFKFNKYETLISADICSSRMCCSEKQRNGQYKIKLLGVLQSYDVGDEAAVKSGCSTFEAAEPLTSVMDGRKCHPNDFLRCPHHSLYPFPVRGVAGPKPIALYCPSVKKW